MIRFFGLSRKMQSTKSCTHQTQPRHVAPFAALCLTWRSRPPPAPRHSAAQSARRPVLRRAAVCGASRRSTRSAAARSLPETPPALLRNSQQQSSQSNLFRHCNSDRQIKHSAFFSRSLCTSSVKHRQNCSESKTDVMKKTKGQTYAASK